MFINGIKIGPNARPKIIAEISGNHNGNKNLFLKLILSAHRNGADFVKIQTYEPIDITLKKKIKIKKGLWKNKTLWSLYEKACTPFKWHEDAFKLAKKYNIKLFSSPFSKRAVDLLEKYNVKLYKIASFEITDLNLIDYIASKKKPIILSTGLSNIQEIKNAIKIIKKYHNKIIILHCVSGYPTNLKNTKLSKIDFLKKKFNKFNIGLSDHTSDNYSSLVACAKNICLIEKHFKLSPRSKGPDSKFSIVPAQLRDLRNKSSEIFNSLNSSKKDFISTEEKNSLIFRRSIYSFKNIAKGQYFTKKNIITLRPKIGIGADNYFKLIGRKAKKNIKKMSPIYFKDVE